MTHGSTRGHSALPPLSARGPALGDAVLFLVSRRGRLATYARMTLRRQARRLELIRIGTGKSGRPEHGDWMAHELMRYLRCPNERIVFQRPGACMRWRDFQLHARSLARRASTGQQSCTFLHDDLTLFQAVTWHLLLAINTAQFVQVFLGGTAQKAQH